MSQQRSVPLWNPYLFAGAPFLANGQHSAYYPFSVLFYVLPLTLAYGWFTVSQLFLAGAFMYVFTRVVGMGRLASLTAAMIYQLSGFDVVSVVFTMIIASAAWLPVLLAAIELIIRQKPILGRPSTVPWIVLGATALACQIMAGHIEITYYTLLIMALYALWRLVAITRSTRQEARGKSQAAQRTPFSLCVTHDVRVLRRPVFALIVLVLLGVGMSAVQLLPYIEILPQNFRVGSATLEQVRSWALPPRHVLAMLMQFLRQSGGAHRFRYYDGAERAAQQPLQRAESAGRLQHDVGHQELRRGRGLPGLIDVAFPTHHRITILFYSTLFQIFYTSRKRTSIETSWAE